jgi:hypothetical protein
MAGATHNIGTYSQDVAANTQIYGFQAGCFFTEALQG